jgi:CubicO group peptidase (beta-lactamase class C family)
MTRYLVALIDQGRYPGGRLASPQAFAEMQSLQIETGDGHFGRTGYGYGLSVTPGFLGHKMVSHGGSIAVSTAHIAFVPDARIGIVMMGNGPGLPYGTVAESVLALLLGRDPGEALPANGIRERMNRLVGEYATYRGLEKLKVSRRGGMLYMGEEEPDTPLIPEDPTLVSTRFYTMSDGLRSPVEFEVGEDGSVILIVGRDVYRRKG